MVLLQVAGALFALSSQALAAPVGNNQGGGNITWVDCLTVIPDEISQIAKNLTSVPPTVRCGNISVPLDHSKPLSSDNSININFAIGGDPNAKRVLNLNPGGPSELASPFAWHYGLPTVVGPAYFNGLDPGIAVLGVDLRGTGYSTPLPCKAKDLSSQFSLPPQNASQWNATAKGIQDFAATCGDLIHHMTSNDTVRDYEIVRKALGFEKVSFLGVSYGTRFAGDYVRLFPDSVDNVVLDGVFPPGISSHELVYYAMADSARLIDRADAFCMVDEECPFHGQGKGALSSAFTQVLEKADNGTFANLTGDDVRLATTYIYLPGRPDFPAFAEAVNLAINNNATGFDVKSTAPSLFESEILPWPILCADLPYYPNFQEYSDILKNASSVDKYGLKVAGTALFLAVCNGWPVKGNQPNAYFDFEKHVLLVQSDYDYNTPAEFAIQSFNHAKNSTLVMRHGENHGSFYVPGPARDAMFAFINNGTIPQTVDSSLVTVWNHDDSLVSDPTVRDPYNTVLGKEAGDLNQLRNITFNAENSTATPVQVTQDNSSGNGSGNGNAGSHIVVSGTLLMAVGIATVLLP